MTWEEAGFDRESRSATADATGAGVIDFGPVRAGMRWDVERIFANAPAGSATVQVGSSLVSTTNLATIDSTSGAPPFPADEASPIRVRAGEFVRVSFTGAGAGAALSALVQYTLLRRVRDPGRRQVSRRLHAPAVGTPPRVIEEGGRRYGPELWGDWRYRR